MTRGVIDVVLDTSAAEAALAFLQETWGGKVADGTQGGWRALLDAPAYSAWAKCYGLSREDLAALAGSPPISGSVFAPETPRVLRRLLDAFVEGRDRVAELSWRLVRAEQLPVAGAARCAFTALPSDTTLQATVFVLLSGDRQGMANDDGQVTVDLLNVPLGPADEAMTAFLAHELHHIGVNHWLQRDAALQATVAAGGPKAAVALTVCMLLIEGTANAFFTPSDVAWMRDLGPELAAMGVDEAALRDFAHAVLEGQQQIPNLIQEVDDVLIGMLAGPADADVLRYPYHMTAPRPGLPRPIAHFLGEVMVNAIREHAGDQAAVDAIRDWRRFVPLYQAAAPTVELPRFRAETVERLGAFLHSA